MIKQIDGLDMDQFSFGIHITVIKKIQNYNHMYLSVVFKFF